MNNHEEIDQIENSIDELQERLSQLKDKALAEAGPIVHNYAESAKQVTTETAKRTDAYAKENPWQVAALAAGVGALVAGILSRGKNLRK